MSKIKDKIVEYGITAVFVVILLILAYGASWIITCGIIKLITLCFGLEFNWLIATGVWLVMCLLKSIFKSNVNVKNK